MQVAFYKVHDGRLCAWKAAPPRRKRFQGTTMASGRDLPHDLAQFVVNSRSAPRVLGTAGAPGTALAERADPGQQEPDQAPPGLESATVSPSGWGSEGVL
jgi:hypothetical protein